MCNVSYDAKHFRYTKQIHAHKRLGYIQKSDGLFVHAILLPRSGFEVGHKPLLPKILIIIAREFRPHHII